MDIIKNFKRNKTAFLASILKRVPFLFKDDELYLKLLFLFEMHYWPDLKHPKTFNEYCKKKYKDLEHVLYL